MDAAAAVAAAESAAACALIEDDADVSEFEDPWRLALQSSDASGECLEPTLEWMEGQPGSLTAPCHASDPRRDVEHRLAGSVARVLAHDPQHGDR